jgi:transaldolase
MNSLKKLEALGQSIWLDYISRDLLRSGKLTKLIKEDGLRGITSNPTIFEKSISEGHDYEEDVNAMAQSGKTVQEIEDALTQKDVQEAADVFRPLYDQLNGQDGYVSLEVNPHLAYNTKDTIEEARRLWKAVDRPNIFIKVPATKEGLPAIRQLTSEGINVNITLLFGIPRYRDVVDAYLSGIEMRIANGEPVTSINSVASFFLSRIDVLLDPILETRAKHLVGEIAIASAKLAYSTYTEIFGSERFKKLAENGARVQRLLWASTSTKNPKYSDVKYVEALIGAPTINTLPLKTIDAYRDHGDPKPTLDKNFEDAINTLKMLTDSGISLCETTQQLENEGVEKFATDFDKLLDTLKSVLAQKNPTTSDTPPSST